MSTFAKGMRVWFDTPEGRVLGTVIRVNKKTVSVDPGRGGDYYRVPPMMLHPVDEPMADALRGVKVARLSLSQDQLHACVQKRPDSEAIHRLERVRAIVENPGGRLVIVADVDDVLRGHIHGWEALAILLHGTHTALAIAGRLDLQIDGFNDDSRALFQIPETQRWLAHLQGMLPWVGAWLDADIGTAFQLVGALAPWQVTNGQPERGREQVEAAVQIANYAIAFTRMLGGTDLAHVDGFLSIVGITSMPDGFFDGVEALADQMDPAGRVTRGS